MNNDSTPAPPNKRTITIDGETLDCTPADLPAQTTPGYLTLRDLARRYAGYVCSSATDAAVATLRELDNLRAVARAGSIRIMHRAQLTPVHLDASGMNDDSYMAECRISTDSARKYLCEHGALSDDEARRALGEQTPADDGKPEPAPHAPSEPPELRKRQPLIDEVKDFWPSIERDLRDASRNGLADAARVPDQHGFWQVAPALEWATQRGKIEKRKAQSFVIRNEESPLAAMLRQLHEL